MSLRLTEPPALCFGSLNASAISDLTPGAEYRWRVAHTKGRQEKALADDLAARGIPYYLPLVSNEQLRVVQLNPLYLGLNLLFPGYLFMFARVCDLYTAYGTKRLVKVIEVSLQAQLIAELSAIHHLLTSVADSFYVLCRLVQGESVEVISGPLKGIVGTVVKSSADDFSSPYQRLTINMTTLGRSIELSVERGHIRRCNTLHTRAATEVAAADTVTATKVGGRSVTISGANCGD